jgi:hypothetical protein
MFTEATILSMGSGLMILTNELKNDKPLLYLTNLEICILK